MALFLPIFAFAEDKLDTGDTAWMMISTALVLLMTPAGLALFYGGMTRSKNVLNTYAMVMGAFVVAFLVWIIAGYSIAFGTNSSATLQNDILLMYLLPSKEHSQRLRLLLLLVQSLVV